MALEIILNDRVQKKRIHGKLIRNFFVYLFESVGGSILNEMQNLTTRISSKSGITYLRPRDMKSEKEPRFTSNLIGRCRKYTSIVIPNLDGGYYLDECLKSIIRQKKNNEIIVVDGDSSDLSKIIIEKHKEKLHTMKVREI